MQSSRLFLVTLGALTLGLSAPVGALPPSNPGPGAPGPLEDR